MDYSAGGPPTAVETEIQLVYSTPNFWTPTSICFNSSSVYSVCGFDVGTNRYCFWQNSVVRTPGECTSLYSFPMIDGPRDDGKVKEYTEKPTSWMAFNFILSHPGEVGEYNVNVLCE